MKILVAISHQSFLQNWTSMFPEHSFYLIGTYATEWKTLFPWHPDFKEPKIEYDERRIDELKFSHDDFDLMLDVVETNDYIPNYFKVSKNWDLPRVRKILYTFPSRETIIQTVLRYALKKRWKSTKRLVKYLKKFQQFPLVYENWMLKKAWTPYNLPNGRVILNTVEPWFTEKWVGDLEGVVTVCNGASSWRKDAPVVQIAKKVLREVKGQNCLWDACEKWLPEKDFARMMSHYRVYLETSTDRPLTLSFQQVMNLGMPVVAYDSGITCYAQVIDHGVNGFIAKNIRELKEYCELLLKDYDSAREIGEAGRKTAEALWSFKVVKPRWEQAFEEALEV